MKRPNTDTMQNMVLFSHLTVQLPGKIKQARVLMGFGKLRKKSVTIRNYRKTSDAFRKNVWCIPLAVVIMTTANGMSPTFSGRQSKFVYIFWYLPNYYQCVEVHTDIAPGFFKSTRNAEENTLILSGRYFRLILC